MSWGPLIHGHAPAGLTRALRDAAARGTSFGAPTALEVDLGLAVRRLMPSVERVRFVNSGTEAVMMAFRMVRTYTGKTKIVKFQNAFITRFIEYSQEPHVESNNGCRYFQREGKINGHHLDGKWQDNGIL